MSWPSTQGRWSRTNRNWEWSGYKVGLASSLTQTQGTALWRPKTTKETHQMCCNGMEASKKVWRLWQTSLLGLHFMQQQGDALFSTERPKCRKVLLHWLSQRFLFWFGIWRCQISKQAKKRMVASKHNKAKKQQEVHQAFEGQWRWFWLVPLHLF